MHWGTHNPHLPSTWYTHLLPVLNSWLLRGEWHLPLVLCEDRTALCSFCVSLNPGRGLLENC